jgi:hypothetical protein
MGGMLLGTSDLVVENEDKRRGRAGSGLDAHTTGCVDTIPIGIGNCIGGRTVAMSNTSTCGVAISDRSDWDDADELVGRASSSSIFSGSDMAEWVEWAPSAK